MSSTKSAIGHLLGAAGAVEAVATILALRDKMAPPTLGWEEQEEGMDLDYVPNEAQPLKVNGQPADRAFQRVRVRRPQRRALPGGCVSTTVDREGRRVTPEPAVEDGPAHAAAASRRAVRRGLADPPALGRRVQAHGGEGARGRRRDRRRRPRRRPPGLLLRAGPVLPRRLARRGARGVDHPRPAAGRPRGRARRRLHRVRRRAHAGGPRRARRLRPHLPRARRAVRPHPADLRDLRRERRRRLVLARARPTSS